MKKMVLLVLFITQCMLGQELALVRKDGLWGYLNRKGEFAIKPAYQSAKNFSDGLAAVKIDSKWGFINMKGELAIPANFDDIKYFNSGINWVKKDDVWMYINKKGEESITLSPPFYLQQAAKTIVQLLLRRGTWPCRKQSYCRPKLRWSSGC